MNPKHRERVAARAYEIWEKEGRPDNKDAEHWQRAEQDVAREEASQQMGGRSEAAPVPDIDTRPAPPVKAAPPLGDAPPRPGPAPDDGPKRILKKPTRARRKPGDRQQD